MLEYEVRAFYDDGENVTSWPLGEAPMLAGGGPPISGFGIYQRREGEPQVHFCDFGNDAIALVAAVNVCSLLNTVQVPIQVWVTDGIATVDEATIPTGVEVHVRDYDYTGDAEQAAEEEVTLVFDDAHDPDHRHQYTVTEYERG